MTEPTNRRDALKCLGVGAGTLFTLQGGVFSAFDLAEAQADMGAPLFLQISDTHIGFNKDANPDVVGTLNRTIDIVNAMPARPDLVLHTGDVSHLSKAGEFDTANQLLSRLKVSELHVVPGEHDVTDGPGAEFFARFGKASDNRGYYSFDAHGVHFIALVNVMNFKPNGLGGLGDDQMAWLKDDLAGRSASQPVVVFAHMPLWTIYEPWGWGTDEGEQVAALLRRFGSVTVLNGHIHQIVQKVEGNILFHTARSTAYPQPQAGSGPGPGPLKVPADQLPGMLGVTAAVSRKRKLSLTDSTLA
ncbi:MAG TPA: metallophosphoesterase [Rhizomicrobium sp.]|nr:metallophosphoesterase [Rhizomicrobium sp.]